MHTHHHPPTHPTNTGYGNTTTGNFVDGNSFLIQPSSYIDYIDVILGGRCQGTYEVFGDPVLGVAVSNH